MTNAHISNDGGTHLTRAQQRHLEMIRPLLAEVSVSETARIQTARDTVRWRTEDFQDIVAYGKAIQARARLIQNQIDEASRSVPRHLPSLLRDAGPFQPTTKPFLNLPFDQRPKLRFN